MMLMKALSAFRLDVLNSLREIELPVRGRLDRQGVSIAQRYCALGLQSEYK